MKTTQLKSSKLSTIALFFGLVFISACSNSQPKTEAMQSAVKAPAIDIHTAALTGNLEAINEHIKAGTNLNSKDPMAGSSALITAIVFDKTEVAKALIDAGADLSVKNNEGSTALHVAAFFCRTEMVKLLLEKGADKSIKNAYGATALETVSGPFDAMKNIYIGIGQQLGPMGLKLNIERIENTRPVIVDLLK